MQITALDVARRFVGLREVPGPASNPIISGIIGLVLAEMAGGGMADLPRTPPDDETPWCSAAMFVPALILGLPRPSKYGDPEIRRLALRARSWLMIGTPIALKDARPGYDCVILNRAGGVQDPGTLNAPGHVGLYVSHDETRVLLCGGNQSNQWSESWYRHADLLGVRRWWTGP